MAFSAAERDDYRYQLKLKREQERLKMLSASTVDATIEKSQGEAIAEAQADTKTE